jgi:hypothetical protein
MTKKRCQGTDCDKSPNFNEVGEKAAIFCKKHKSPEMVDVKTPKCQVCKLKQPRFNYGGDDKSKGTHCNDCKLENMIDVVNSKCITCKLKRPSFNVKGQTKPLYCAKCKLVDMINVVDKMCITCNLKQPIFNLSEEIKPLYCADCKDENMINVKNSKCIGCKNTRASYNAPGETKGLYCDSCKLQDMVDVVNRKCTKCNISRPSYNKPGEITALLCASCKEPEMINVVKSLCIKCDAKTPSFNHAGKNKPIFCADCKELDMVNVIDDMCLRCGIIQPVFNNPGEFRGIFCSSCKDPQMVDVKSKICSTYLCGTRIHNFRYKGYCMRCFVHIFPDEPVARNYKTKEKTVASFILENFPNFTWTQDKSIVNGCSKRRPDLLVDFGSFLIVIEVDETQHDTYDLVCENKRMMQISQDVGHRPIVFIRFNPDAYLDKDSKKISSCWGVNTSGLCTIKPSKTQEWAKRLEVLKNTVQHWADNGTSKTLEIISLFFD